MSSRKSLGFFCSNEPGIKGAAARARCDPLHGEYERIKTEALAIDVMKILGIGVIGTLMVLATTTARAADDPATHRVVFEVTMVGDDQWTGVLNNVENLQRAFGGEQTEIEVVAHSNGLGLVLKTNEALANRMKAISATGVVFAACENTMQKKDVTKSDLLPFVRTVDSGVTEVVRKQEAGWSYVKSGS